MKVAIVRDEDDGAGEGVDGFEQDILGAQIEVVGRLVEQQEIRRADENLGQGVAIALAAREHAERLEDIIAGEEKAAEQAAQFGLRDARRGAADVVSMRAFGIEYLVLVLREVFRENVVSELKQALRWECPARRAGG